MSNLSLRPERVTQNRVVKCIATPPAAGGLGYANLGDWSKRDGNRCIEVEYLRANLKKRGYSDAHISQAVQKLMAAADATGLTLYQVNLRTYQLLRYGVQVQVAAGVPHETVRLIDWEQPAQNDFALAEEVTLKGGHERRPDIVLYVNGIAVVVIELKRSSVDTANGIRQLITNQEEIFNLGFFSTVQLALAGSDSQGLRYGTTSTSTTSCAITTCSRRSAAPTGWTGRTRITATSSTTRSCSAMCRTPSRSTRRTNWTPRHVGPMAM